jgi:hypothetical protein
MDIHILILASTFLLGLFIGVAATSMLLNYHRKKTTLQPLMGVVLPRDMKDE